jgi:RNA ligase (TIGR02306 family)
MSEWSVRIVEVGPVMKHPNADSLSITEVEGGYPCIIRTGEFVEGDKAIYIPVDSVVPDTEEFSFLKKKRIEAMRLRGIFSMGLLRPIPESLSAASIGQDVSAALNIIKFVSAGPNGQPILGGECEASPDHFKFVKYSEHLPLRANKKLLLEGEDVVVTEKIHGCNARFVHDGVRLWIGSRSQVKVNDGCNVWSRVAQNLNLAERLAEAPHKIFFGEVFGQVQDLKYGVQGLDFRVFDVYDLKTHTYLDFSCAIEETSKVGLTWVPLLYEGSWSVENILALAEGPSTIPGAKNVREGFVVRPKTERCVHAGRVCLKYHGEGYLTRKNKTDCDV